MSFLSRSTSFSRLFNLLLSASLLSLTTTMVMHHQHLQVAAQAPPQTCDTFCWCDSTGDGNPFSCPDIDNRRLPADFGPEERAKIASLVPNQESLVDFVGDDDCQPYPAVATFLNVEVCDEPEEADEDAVCLFVFDEGQNNCKKRQNYSLKTTEPPTSPSQAINKIKNRAIVTHKGQCGVCSSAQDLAVNLDPALNVNAYICGDILAKFWDGILSNFPGPLPPLPQSPDPIKPALQLAFDAAVDCFSGGVPALPGFTQPIFQVGFTQPCAKMFASNAANSYLSGCTQDCNDYLDPCLALGQPELIGQCAVSGIYEDPAEDCLLNDCLDCDEVNSGPIFAQFSGRTRRSSGIVTVSELPTGTPAGSAFFGLKRECDTVANISNDICGTLDLDDLQGLIGI